MTYQKEIKRINEIQLSLAILQLEKYLIILKEIYFIKNILNFFKKDKIEKDKNKEEMKKIVKEIEIKLNELNKFENRSILNECLKLINNININELDKKDDPKNKTLKNVLINSALLI